VHGKWVAAEERIQQLEQYIKDQSAKQMRGHDPQAKERDDEVRRLRQAIIATGAELRQVAGELQALRARHRQKALFWESEASRLAAGSRVFCFHPHASVALVAESDALQIPEEIGDEDAVFFPNRLKSVLANHVGEAYLSNCKYGLHGPIEVFSASALDAFAADYQRSEDKKAPHTCVNGLNFGEYGEDMFMDQCLSKILQVGAPKVEPLLICEDHCDCPEYFLCPASDSYRVSFHPMKSVGAYENCMGNALNGPLATDAGGAGGDTGEEEYADDDYE